jgi:hypothetical protein
MRKGIELMPADWRAHEYLCALLLQQERWSELWETLPTLLNLSFDEPESKELFLDLCLDIAAAGQAATLLQLVSKSDAAPQLEPLIVGLRIFLGESPLVAQEILEIGQDVAQRIREKQNLLEIKYD